MIELCKKCGNPVTLYTTWRTTKKKKRIPRRMKQCRTCFNRVRMKHYHKKHPPRKPKHKYARNLRERLTDWYVRVLLTGRSGVPYAAWPAWLVELKRAQVKLRRTIHAKSLAR